MPTATTRKNWAYLLYSASRIANEENLAVIGKEIMDTFLIYASHSPDTLNCYQQIDYGWTFDEVQGQRIIGFKLKQHNISLSQLLHEVTSVRNFVKYIQSSNRRKLNKQQWQDAYQAGLKLVKVFERNEPEITAKIPVAKRDFSYKLFAYSYTVKDNNLRTLSTEILDTYAAYSNELNNYSSSEYQSGMDYGYVDNRYDGPKKIFGLKIKNRKILLSDALFIGESLALPVEIQVRYNITLDQWRAFKLIIPMIVMAFERYDYEIEESE